MRYRIVGLRVIAISMTILSPVLGDQLSHSLASLRDADPTVAVVLMMEVAEETTYVRHHQRKIALVLSAMRHFAEELSAAGWTVDYNPDSFGQCSLSQTKPLSF
jgi:deoxyribodipyrimidine photolyase-like uncharacterized protein